MAIQMYRIRVDSSVCSRDAVVSFLNEFTETWFLVEEHGDVTGKHHFQGFYYGPKKCHKTLRSSLKTRCVNPSRGSYSLPDDVCPDPPGWIRYLCKGDGADRPPVVVSGSTAPINVDIQELHREFWANRASFKGRRRSIVDECIDEFEFKPFHRHDVSRWILRRYVDERKPVNIFYVRSIVNLVSAVVNKEEFERLVQEV